MLLFARQTPAAGGAREDKAHGGNKRLANRAYFRTQRERKARLRVIFFYFLGLILPQRHWSGAEGRENVQKTDSEVAPAGFFIFPKFPPIRD